MSDSQLILSAQATSPTTREVLETVRKHLNTLGGAPDDTPAQGSNSVAPEELEVLISDRSANRAADAILKEFSVTRRIPAESEALSKAMQIVEMAASGNYSPTYVRDHARRLMDKVEPWPEPPQPAAPAEGAVCLKRIPCDPFRVEGAVCSVCQLAHDETHRRFQPVTEAELAQVIGEAKRDWDHSTGLAQSILSKFTVSLRP